MRSVRDAGWAVPGDVSVVGYDGIVFAEFSEPPLTTVRQPREAMGRAAVEILLRLIENQEAEAARAAPGNLVRLPVALRVARSTAAPRCCLARHR